MYKVHYSCGKEFIKRGSDLRNNITLSCGHITSKGEYQIHNFLKEHNIVFISQWNNNNKMLLSSGYPCRFDFAIFYSSIEEKPLFLLEYNGLQHYKAQESGWNTTETSSTPSSAMLKKPNSVKKRVFLWKLFPILISIK